MWLLWRDAMEQSEQASPQSRAERGERVIVWLMLAVVAYAAIGGSKRPDHYDEGTVIMGRCLLDCPAPIDRVKPEETSGYKRSDGSFQGQ